MSPLPQRLAEIEVITFDCYGTLIDWEGGAKSTLQVLLATKDTRADLDHFFEAWERAQRWRLDANYIRYREIAAQAFEQVAGEMKLPLTAADARAFADSIGSWTPFPDTVAALAELRRHKRLGIISNIDDDILAQTVKHLGMEFDLLMTAEQAHAYKPSPLPFERARKLLDVPVERLAHAAFGFEYDLVTATELGWRTVLVRRGRAGFPATPVPDLNVADLAELAAQFR